MLKNLFFFFCIISHSLLAESLDMDALKLEGRALANYKTCADIAVDSQDKVMQSYYAEMFTDMSLKIEHYPIEQSDIVDQAYQLSLVEFAKLNRGSLAIFCGSRLDDLTRKMQAKKLNKK